MAYIQDRWKECKTCEHLKAGGFCGKCGCLMPLKVRLKWAKCPIDKWGSVDGAEDPNPPEDPTKRGINRIIEDPPE